MAVFRGLAELSQSVLRGENRHPQLDGLRGLAILMVLLVHTWGYAKGPQFFVAGGRFDLTYIPHLAMLGVDLFFVLSGYLLYSQAMRRPTGLDGSSYWSFLSRRLRRIVPAYYLFLLALFLLIPTHSPMLRLHNAEARWNFLHHLGFIYNFSGDYVHSFSYMWSLAPEMQFYLFFPILAYLTLRYARFGALPALWLSSVLLSAAMLRYSDRIPFQVDISLPYRLNQFLVGCLAAVAVAKARISIGAGRASGWRWAWMPWAGFALLLFLMWEGRQRLLGIIHPEFGFWGLTGCYFWSALVALAFGMILVSAMVVETGWLGKIWANRLLGQIGIVSYGIFLWHNPILENLSKTSWIDGIDDLQVRMAVLFLAILILGFGAGTLSYALVEAPFLRKRSAPSAASLPPLVNALHASNPQSSSKGS